MTDRELAERLLDGIYEMEGLVQLASSRDGVPAAIGSLLKRKCAEVESLIARAFPDSALPEVECVEHAESHSCGENPASNPATGAPALGDCVESERETGHEGKERGRLVFSVNDRYRFKRALFGDSGATFNNTLATVASMEDYEEAEDYFIGELQWDPSNREVSDFLDILSRYFK